MSNKILVVDDETEIADLYSQLKTFSKKLISYFHIENDWGIMVSIWLRGETRDEW